MIARLTLAAALAVATLMPRPGAAAVEIVEVTSPGGITAWLVEEPALPFVAIEIRFEGGASLDGPGKRGATHLMAALLEEGSAGLDATAFQEAVEAQALRLGFDSSPDTVSVSAQMLTENRDASLALLRGALTEPAFAQADIDRVRAQVLASIEGQRTDPQDIAGQTFAALAYGEHPYGSAIEGTEESVAALTRDDLLAAHGAALTRDRAVVGVAGDITPEELGPLLDEILGGLPEASEAEVGEAPFGLEGGVTVVEFPSPQALVLFGHEGIERDDDDFLAAFVLNHVLGGAGFESRLMQEVREARGLTYGIGTYLAPRDHAAQYMGQFSSSNETVAGAVELIRAEWARLAEAGLTAEELDAAKTYLTGAYPLRFDGNASIAGILVGMQMSRLPIDYVDTRNDQVEALTLDEVNAVAAELLDPDGLHFVVVGRPEGLESGAF
jgi:zinc protease